MYQTKNAKRSPSLLLATAILTATSFQAVAADSGEVELLNQQVELLKAQMADLQQKLEAIKEKQSAAPAQKVTATETSEATEATEDTSDSDDGVKIGGAVRFQYSYEDYNDDNQERTGDLDLDTVRLNFDGRYKGLLMSAEYRHYDYMDVVHHAWVGYEFNAQQNVKLGITKVPFGILPFASHNFFFSANYYLGLEDDYDAGIAYHYGDSLFDVDAAFFKNDEKGGVSSSSDRYSYDVVGVHTGGAGLGDAPSVTIAEGNTWNGRFAYHPTFGAVKLDMGLSAQYGGLYDSDDRAGDHNAWALHMVADWQRWNLQLQYSDYSYDLDDFDVDTMVVGAYAYYDEIPTDAKIYTANLAYTLPVDFGPVSALTFYNDFSKVGDKSGGIGDSMINVTGMMITAGPLYTYVDYIVADDQPFIGGTYANGDGSTNHRLNVNVGYYF